MMDFVGFMENVVIMGYCQRTDSYELEHWHFDQFVVAEVSCLFEKFFFFLASCFFIPVVSTTFAVTNLNKKVGFVVLAWPQIVVGEKVDKCDRQKTMIMIICAEVGKQEGQHSAPIRFSLYYLFRKMVWTDFVIVSEVGFETASEIKIEVVAAIAFSEVA